MPVDELIVDERRGEKAYMRASVCVFSISFVYL